MLRTLLTVLVLLVLPATAVADRWPPRVVEKAILVADAHWPYSKCRAQHQITWMTSDELAAEFPGDPHAIARGSYEGCRVWIAWDRIDPFGILPQGEFLCAVLEHEFGHNAGLQHSSNPRDIMYPDIVTRPSDCAAAFEPPASLGSLRWGRGRLPARAAGSAHLGYHRRHMLHGVLQRLPLDRASASRL